MPSIKLEKSSNHESHSDTWASMSFDSRHGSADEHSGECNQSVSGTGERKERSSGLVGTEERAVLQFVNRRFSGSLRNSSLSRGSRGISQSGEPLEDNVPLSPDLKEEDMGTIEEESMQDLLQKLQLRRQELGHPAKTSSNLLSAIRSLPKKLRSFTNGSDNRMPTLNATGSSTDDLTTQCSKKISGTGAMQQSESRPEHTHMPPPTVPQMSEDALWPPDKQVHDEVAPQPPGADLLDKERYNTAVEGMQGVQIPWLEPACVCRVNSEGSARSPPLG
jgi:hypothetical protein